MSEPKFADNDRVRRSGGSYRFPGRVLASFLTLSGLRLYAVEHHTEVGLVHVFREADLHHDDTEDS